MNREQMEMRWDGEAAGRRPLRFRRRTSRARWWFEQMRLAVDQAPDLRGVPAEAEGRAAR